MDDQPSATRQTVSVEFSLGIGGSKIGATAVVPAGRTNLTQILPILQSLDDSLVANVASQMAEAGHPVSCKRGCTACCHQMIPISIFEAEALAAWIRTLPEALQHELAERFHQTLLKLATAGLIDRMVNVDWFPEDDSTSQLAIDYLHQHIPCPFLENDSCSIYPFRPFACREYLVTSPPEHCLDLASPQLAPVDMPHSFSLTLHGIGAAIEHNSHGWIPLVFLFAWMKAGAHPGEAVSGTGPEVLYEFVSRIDQSHPPSAPNRNSHL